MFRDKIIAHLGQYNKDVSGISEKGEYNYRGEIKLYDHILPVLQEKKNILPPYRNPFWNSDYARINLHRYFHHLNSSQALCINLFYPLIVENRIEVVGKLLDIPLNGDISCQYEYVSDIEERFRKTRKTNFDFFMSNNESKVYFEVKYTENEFGSAKSDSSHREKFDKVYASLLKENPYIRDEFKNQDLFLKNYQIMRNLIHICEHHFVVFLIPKQNKKIYSQAQKAKTNILTDSGRKLFRIALLEEWIDYLVQIADWNLRDYFTDFKKKYFPRHLEEP